MGLIYVSAESAQLIQSLQANLQSAKETIDQLKSGSHKIVAAVDGKTLSGAAYTAGKNLFNELVIPTIAKVTNAFEQIEQELQTYQAADAHIANEGYLDEDILLRQITIKKTIQAAVEAAMHTMRSLANSNPAAQIVETLSDAQYYFNQMINDLEADIREVEKKLEKLYQFSSETNHLFQTSLTDLNIAMQGVSVLNHTIVYDDGSYQLPKGTNKDWFFSLQTNAKEKLEQSASATFLTFYQQVEDLLSPFKGKKSDNIKRFELLLKQYPAATVKKLLANDEFWLLANKLPARWQTKLINGLAKYEDFGQAVAHMKWLPKVDTLGKAYETFNKFTNPVKTFASESLKNSKFVQNAKQWGVAKGLGKAATVATYAQLGITFVASSVDNYGKTGSIGKGMIGGAIDTVKSIGPLEGMTIGAAMGGPPGIVVGGLAGLANAGIQFFWPQAHDNVKNGFYKFYDKNIEVVGISINQSIETVHTIYKDVQTVGKSVGKVLSSAKLLEIKLG